jgi:CheY-like chemotaxis protein
MIMPLSATEQQAAACSFHLPVILLADDDKDDRNFFADALAATQDSAQLVMVNNGEELMNYLQTSKLPDLLYLDLNMPRKNGALCLTEIKRNPLLSGIPVVILSTSINEAKRNQLIEEGASFCFTKPAEFSSLVSLLKKSIQLILYANQQPAVT